jgi:hypothetical protein
MAQVTSQDPAGETGYGDSIGPSNHTRGDGELGHSIAITMLIPAAALEDLDNDPSMWNVYVKELIIANEEDIRITHAWKEDANSILTFVSLNLLVPVFVSVTSSKTGLSSAIVGAFIIEFYKKLSSDSGDETVALLRQISHQLPNSPLANSTDSNTANQPSSPGAAIVWVIAIWLISLVLSLTCALIATLLQQWCRTYIETSKYPRSLRHRARVRSLLFVGTKLYKVPLIVEMLPILLHLSVYLFLFGLVIAFHPIHKTVAIVVDVAVGVSGLVYFTLNILPCLDVRCPYRTPISKILWYPCRAFLSLAAPLGWLQSRGFTSSNRWQYFTDGLEECIFNRAVEAPEGDDHGRLTRLFNQLALGDRRTFLEFVTSIPRHKILDLILSVEPVLLRGSLFALLRSSLAGIGKVDVSRRSLLVCLHAICHIAKAPIPDPDLDFMRTNIANTDLMEDLWNDNNTAIRVTSRSICALLAKQVTKQVVRNWPRGPRLRWLEGVIGDAPDTNDVATWDRMNLKSFINGVLTDLQDKLPTEDATYFEETLAILLDVPIDLDFDTNFQSRLSAEVRRMREDDSAISDDVVDKLHSMFRFLLETPSSTSAPSSHAASAHAASTRAASATAAHSPVASSNVTSGPAASTAPSLHHDPLTQV